ncbi:MFS transporter [Pseudonocardia lacus]|uniref:MFS transporter n=1 Tax=Pseudonocardia lacus TaxID=2835865 RepID=UPI001BDDA4C6|nr:MFS transporter [Pseudonocardia lacus]
MPARPTTSPRAALLVAGVALFTDLFVYGVAIPVLPLLPAVVGAGPSATGFLFASYAVAMVVVTPLAGRAVDRFGTRGPLMAGLVGLAVAVLLFTAGGPFWLLLVARTAQGAAGGLAWVASMALIAAVTPLERRGQAFGVAMSAVSVGLLVGPPVAGVLVAAFGPAAPFVVAAALAVVDGVLRLVLVRATPPSDDDVAGPTALVRVPGTVSIVGAVVVGAALLSATEPVLPLQLTSRFGLDAAGVGLVFAVAVLTSILANLVVGRWTATTSPRVLIGAGAAAGALSLAVVGLVDDVWAVSAGMGLLGVATALVFVPATVLIGEQGARAVPPTLGGAYALFNLAYAGGIALGPIVAGSAVEGMGFGSALLLVAAATLAGGLAALVRLPGATPPTALDQAR